MINGKRTRNLYDSKSVKAFRLSRSAIESFVNCPRCFYLDRKLGVSPPGFPPFTLNIAVDNLLKNEFDIYRKSKKPHPLMLKSKIKAIPFSHPDLERWRANFTGIQYLHKPTNLLITGAVDDIWINDKKELIVVDYKATAKAKEVLELNEEWHDSYKRQMEIYQWLLRMNGFKVSKVGYWVYANGDSSVARFDETLSFRMTVISHKGDDSWVEDTIKNAKKCLSSSNGPKPTADCEHCAYLDAVSRVEK